MVTVRQHYLDCLAQAGYSIESEGSVFVIDPRRDVDEFVGLIESRNLKLKGVLLTHLHADFVAGHLELARRYGAPLYLGRAAGAEYLHVPIEDGMEIRFGQARLLFWETPGHTPGDISTLLFDMSRPDDAPVAVFTGDTLFNGDVGRPDLLASFGIGKEELVGKLHRSVQRLMRLPDATTLYPGHGSGSLCGKHLGAETVSTIGRQRVANYAVQAKTLEEFSRAVLTGQTEAPRYFGMDAVLNKKGIQAEVGELLARTRALSGNELRRFLDERQSHNLLDVRDAKRFADGFLPGFVNVSLDGTFASWAGTLLDERKPVVLVVSSKEQAAEAVVRLARVGIETVEGYFVADEDALARLGGELASFVHLSGTEALERARSGGAVLVDVRTPGELETSGGVPQAVNFPLAEFTAERIAETLPDRSRPSVVFCAGGYRSVIAVSLLVANGYRNVADVSGGFENIPR